MTGPQLAVRAMYCLTAGVVATGVGGLLWMAWPPLGFGVGVALSLGAGLVCERVLDAIQQARAARKDNPDVS